MTWTPPPPDRERDQPSGPSDAAPWSTPPIPQYSPGWPRAGQPEDTVPTPAAPPRLRHADWGERAAATLIDWSLLLAVTLALGVVSSLADPLEDLAGLAWLGAVGYLAWLNGSKGQSPGKALLGLELVRDTDGSHLGGFVGLLRGGLLMMLSFATVGIFFVICVMWPFRDPKNRAVHDLIVSGAVVSGHPRARVGLGLLRP
ncbi:RDD family protein [Serinicoccus kebangsaanensis]|uniref:RDD family protein n=1 Tax=Serinicoccus kebangsaanensis TaxID=2602069 RepID=UPI00124D298F|nr:RDD family protein [Serinicoccus kebangsaanensis]